MRRLLMLSSVLLFLFACPPPANNVVVNATPGDGAGQPADATPVPPPAPAADAAPVLGAPGTACDNAAQCQSGTCEGLGCGPGEGRCASSDRKCTMDHVAYCGCDGQTFFSSGSCPGQRFAAKGECAPPPPPPKAADGGACNSADDCASGICEGKGCDAGQGVCAPKDRKCTRDHKAFCGCDGKTFKASGTCPGARYAEAGACKAPKPVQQPTK